MPWISQRNHRRVNTSVHSVFGWIKNILFILQPTNYCIIEQIIVTNQFSRLLVPDNNRDTSRATGRAMSDGALLTDTINCLRSDSINLIGCVACTNVNSKPYVAKELVSTKSLWVQYFCYTNIYLNISALVTTMFY